MAAITILTITYFSIIFPYLFFQEAHVCV